MLPSPSTIDHIGVTLCEVGAALTLSSLLFLDDRALFNSQIKLASSFIMLSIALRPFGLTKLGILHEQKPNAEMSCKFALLTYTLQLHKALVKSSSSPQIEEPSCG